VSTGRKIATLLWHERARIYKRSPIARTIGRETTPGEADGRGETLIRKSSFSLGRNEKLIALAQRWERANGKKVSRGGRARLLLRAAYNCSIARSFRGGERVCRMIKIHRAGARPGLPDCRPFFFSFRSVNFCKLISRFGARRDAIVRHSFGRSPARVNARAGVVRACRATCVMAARQSISAANKI